MAASKVKSTQQPADLFSNEGVPTTTKWMSNLVNTDQDWSNAIAASMRDHQTGAILNVNQNCDRQLYQFIRDGVSVNQTPSWASNNEDAKVRMNEWLGALQNCFPARATVTPDELTQMMVDLQAYADQLDTNVHELRNRADITDSDAEHMWNVVRAMRAAAEPLAQVAELLNQSEIECLQLNVGSI